MRLICFVCNSEVGNCAECGKEYKHGTAAKCSEVSCSTLNAPVDCKCGYAVSADLRGVLSLEQKLIPFKKLS
jgi:hypothetical protein